MERRRLGSSERDVAIVGIGGKGLTGARRGLEPADVQKAIAAAIEAGCELVDLSAPSLPGLAGEAERRVGDELRALRARDRVVVATAARGSGARAPVPGQLQATVEDSLRALRVDALPLVWLDGWRDAWLDERGWPELRGALARLVKEGKVLAWGAALPDDDSPPGPTTPFALSVGPEGAEVEGRAPRLLGEPWLAAIQLRYSLFDRRAERTLLPAAQAAKVGVVAREPLAAGGLAGDLGPTTYFPPGDERLAWPQARWLALPPEHARLAALVATTPPVATATDDGRALLATLRHAPDVAQADVAELALRFAIAHPAITAAIPGVRTIAHALVDLACADGRPLPALVRAALDERAWCPAWYGLA